jgi:GNAT superfamily N-acetyltransferase
MTAVMTTAQVRVDRLRPDDGPALAAMFERCSQDTIVGRFFTGLRELPRRYLEGAVAGPPAQHDALVLRYADGLDIAGLASFVADLNSPLPSGELGVLIEDDWQRRGYGTELVATLLDQATERGVEELTVAVLPGRLGLLLSLARRLELISVADEDDYLTAHYRIRPGVDDGNS